MDVKTLKTRIKSKQLPNYLIFSGDEWKVQEIYINQISRALNLDMKRIDCFSEVYNSLRNKSFLNKPVIYIVRDDKDLIQNEKVQHLLADGILKDNYLIHLISSIDKRTKFYKRYKDTIIEFGHLTDALLKRYIKKNISLSDRNCQMLVDICEHDYGRILLEIDKIKCYQATDRLIVGSGSPNQSEEDLLFQMLVKDGTIYEPPYDAIFDLVDAILSRKVNKTFDLLEQSYAVGEATMVMLSVLYNNAKAVLQVQTYSGNNLSAATGLTGYQIKCAKKYVGKYSEEELNYIVHLVHKVMNGIKTGRMEDMFAMQYLLVHIM